MGGVTTMAQTEDMKLSPKLFNPVRDLIAEMEQEEHRVAYERVVRRFDQAALVAVAAFLVDQRVVQEPLNLNVATTIVLLVGINSATLQCLDNLLPPSNPLAVTATPIQGVRTSKRSRVLFTRFTLGPVHLALLVYLYTFLSTGNSTIAALRVVILCSWVILALLLGSAAAGHSPFRSTEATYLPGNPEPHRYI